MSKYDSLVLLKKTMAKTAHECFHCGAQIPKGETYYREHIEDRFLQRLHAKAFCESCVTSHGDALLKAD